MEVLKKAIALSLASSIFLHAEGLDQILSNSSGTFDFAGPSSIKTQVRGYYNFGGMSVRSDIGGSIRPFNITLPSISSGCGGVDIAWGGFSFLNIDQLVQKLQKIASAAPAFAFNMALSALCKDCQSIMDQLNAIADSINGLNFDACKSAVSWGKSLGNVLNSSMDNRDDAMSGIKSVLNKTAEETRKWTEKANGYINCGPTGSCTDTSAAAVKAKIIESKKFQGSLIKKLFNDNAGFLSEVRSGFDSTSSYAYWLKGLSALDAEDLFRNMIGDFYGYVDPDFCGGEDKDGGIENFSIAYVVPGMSPEETVSIFLGKEATTTSLKGLSIKHEESLETACGKGMRGKPDFENTPHVLSSSMPANSIRKAVLDRLKEVLVAMDESDSNTVKNAAETINKMKYPVYRALNVASVTKDEDLITYIADVIVAQEIVGLVNEIMKKARAGVSLASRTESTKAASESQLKTIEERIQKINTEAAKINSETMKKMQERLAQIGVLKDVSERYKRQLFLGIGRVYR